MKQAKKPRGAPPPKVRNPVARSLLLHKGGAHGRTTRAKRRAANVALAQQARDPDALE